MVFMVTGLFFKAIPFFVARNPSFLISFAANYGSHEKKMVHHGDFAIAFHLG